MTTGRRGRLSVVGLGPGSRDQLTDAAKAALREADLVIGYRGYLELVPPDLAAAPREAYELGQERSRARRAAQAAAGGSDIALVSGGDAGVYGMAALALDEVAELGREAPGATVVPGVTAALAAASLLGAPLAVDFACLSLSDLLLPWPELERKVDALAAADIVLVLYNPASASRRRPWHAAVASIQRYRPAATPAAAVSRAYRPGQSVRLCEVGSLHALDVDMETVVVVGSSRTRRRGDWLLTMRDERPLEGEG